MPYNPNIHHRRSIRLKGYDYAQAGLYFITICCQDRACLFGEVDERGEMILNEYGQIAHDEWVKLHERFPNFILDVFQIMPDHMHGIIAWEGATLAVAQNGDNRAGASPAPTTQNDTKVAISDVLGAYKSLVAKHCLEVHKSKNEIMGKLWQRNYYERIIRDKLAYHNISNYIINNPAKWAADKFYK